VGTRGAASPNHVLGSRMHEVTTHKILVVEDEPILQKVTTSQLKTLGYDFDVVSDGQEAVDKITSSQTYDLVLMDVELPSLSGLEATEIIRSHEAENRETIVRANHCHHSWCR